MSIISYGKTMLIVNVIIDASINENTITTPIIQITLLGSEFSFIIEYFFIKHFINSGLCIFN
jgi:hypothetical protein